MITSTEVLEQALQQQPIVRRQIGEIKAELASDNPKVMDGTRVMLKGEAARALLTTILEGLTGCDELYDICKSELSN